MASNPLTKITEEQYLEFERAAEFRHEFVDGEILAMSGASLRHSVLQVNIFFELRTGLPPECQAYNSGLRVRVSSAMHAYPDVFVVCGEPRVAEVHHDHVLNPVAIFEVLSPSTKRYDRGIKFQRYRAIESLRDYLLVSQDRARIEHHSRQADGTWLCRDLQGLDNVLDVNSIRVCVPLRRLYAGVEV